MGSKRGKSPRKNCKSKGSLASKDPCLQEIVKALQEEQSCSKCKSKPKVWKPPPMSLQTCPTPQPPPLMRPSMSARMQFIGHCPVEPFAKSHGKPDDKVPLCPYKKRCRLGRRLRMTREGRELAREMRQRTGHAKLLMKRLPYPKPGGVTMGLPVTCIKHEWPVVKDKDKDREIINIPSPITSGDKIAVQRATVLPLKPPLPPKSGHELFKPHSGIVMNIEPGNFPEGAAPIPGRMPLRVCNNKNCKKKKCRRRAAMLRKRMAAKSMGMSVEEGGAPYVRQDTPVVGGSRSAGGARDGRPRARASKRFVPDDDDDPCGLDDIPRPDNPQIPKELRKGMFKTHSLTVLPCKRNQVAIGQYYGILMGTINMYSDRFGARSRGKQALTMSVMGYCLAFHYHPKQWSMKLVDNLVDAGDQWYMQLVEKVHDHSAYQGMCEVMPFGKKQVLLLNRKRMQVLLSEPDIVGYTMSKDPTVYNLCKGLRAFFKDNRAGVLMTRVLKLVIWRDKICYYIFDPAGRNSKAYSNYSNGAAALLNLKDVAAVGEILLTRSCLDDQKFVLAPVKVLRIVPETDDDDLEEEKELSHAEKAKMSYKILDENCAIVNAGLHLGDRVFEDAKWRQSLPIAIAALSYAKISPSNTWYTKTIDKIIRFGNKLYLDCSNPKVLVDLTIDNIPNEISIGPYLCEIIIYRERVKGQLFTTKECLFNIRTGLEEFFSKEYSSGILDFHTHNIAFWKQKDMFYMFDPYPRTNEGERVKDFGQACCFMFLNTDAMARAFIKIWDYLPASTLFYMHPFKVLKLKKKTKKTNIKCTLSDANLPGAKVSRKVLQASQARGDGDVVTLMTADSKSTHTARLKDEEEMGDIVSLVESIQDGYLPPIPIKYKNMPPEPIIPKILSLDSPTVSVTQVIPPWPKPRDKTNEPEEPDPEYEPTPPPTPPPPPPPEGEEEEEAEEELDEEMLLELARRKAEEEEERRRRAERLPPPLPPPPPTPQDEEDKPSKTAAEGIMGGIFKGEGEADGPREAPCEDEILTLEPVRVQRKVLLTEDAKRRYQMRQSIKKITPPLNEETPVAKPEEEINKPHNFKTLLDNTQIIQGMKCVDNEDAVDVLPFVSIMAIVTSYKYQINTWSAHIVDFIIDGGIALHQNKRQKFQLAPIHIIPKIGIGQQTYHANIDVVGEGATWQMEDVLNRKFFPYFDRGIITMMYYSCAVFHRNGLFYLFDGSQCNPMGFREPITYRYPKEKGKDGKAKDGKSKDGKSKDGKSKDKKSKDGKSDGKACFFRFRSLHELVSRVCYNKSGRDEDQQFILSRVLVRRLLGEPRQQLPENYDYDNPQASSSKPWESTGGKHSKYSKVDKEQVPDYTPLVGYHFSNGLYRIEGTTAVPKDGGGLVGRDHFVCLVAMLMATMHPIRTWDTFMVDSCIEKGIEIFSKATFLGLCQKRVIKNIIIDGKFININVKKIIVVNRNPSKTLEQYMYAVMNRLRYVIIRFPARSMVVCRAEGYYHLFDPQAYPKEKPLRKDPKTEKERKKQEAEDKKMGRCSKDDMEENLSTEEVKGSKQEQIEAKKKQAKRLKELENTKIKPVASWSLYKDLCMLIARIRNTVAAADLPTFYTFELTSVKSAPLRFALDYRLSPLFRPDQNPNAPYLHPRRQRPLVDEKMYWLHIDTVPWSRMTTENDLGFPRNTPRTLWRDWDIEFPGDLFSLWGTIHPLDRRFSEETRGKQYLCTCVVAIVMTKAVYISAWNSRIIDGIVLAGDKYHDKCYKKIGKKKSVELQVENLTTSFDDMYPYKFQVKFEKIIFGFMYNVEPDRFNLSQSLSYFFENNDLGLLVSPVKNLAFGKIGTGSYFMFDCQTHGLPIFSPGQGAAYILKCESLNRLIYCMTITLNVRSHGQPFHLYSVPTVNVTIADAHDTKSSKSSKSSKSGASKLKSSKSGSSKSSASTSKTKKSGASKSRSSRSKSSRSRSSRSRSSRSRSSRSRSSISGSSKSGASTSRARKSGKVAGMYE